MSVVFDFSASLNDVAPLSPISLPVDVKRNEKSELLIYTFWVFFLLTLPLRSSLVSVVFDLSDSLNDVAPISLMWLSVYVMIKENSELLMDVFCVSSFFCLHNTDRVQ